MAIVRVNAFPYAENNIEAPYTDGLVASGADANIYMPPIGGKSQYGNNNRKLSGTYCDQYLGNTSMVFCDRIWYAHDAGDF